MKILTASYIITFDENFTILKDGCIVFDEKIIELASYDIIIKKSLCIVFEIHNIIWFKKMIK